MQDQVFQYQQKPYNIISFKPKIEPDAHRPYPKFHLEHLARYSEDNHFEIK